MTIAKQKTEFSLQVCSPETQSEGFSNMAVETAPADVPAPTDQFRDRLFCQYTVCPLHNARTLRGGRGDLRNPLCPLFVGWCRSWQGFPLWGHFYELVLVLGLLLLSQMRKRGVVRVPTEKRKKTVLFASNWKVEPCLFLSFAFFKKARLIEPYTIRFY